MSEREALEAALRELAVPLLDVDQATLYLVDATPSRVHLHLGGAYSGCAGRAYVERGLLAPLVASVSTKATLTVTSGLPVPAGATLLSSTDTSLEPGRGDLAAGVL